MVERVTLELTTVNIQTIFDNDVYKTEDDKLILVIVPVHELGTGVTGLTNSAIAVSLVALVRSTLELWLFFLVARLTNADDFF